MTDQEKIELLERQVKQLQEVVNKVAMPEDKGWAEFPISLNWITDDA